MSKVDWSKAPEDAEFYAEGSFRKLVEHDRPPLWDGNEWTGGGYRLDTLIKSSDYEKRPEKQAAESIESVATQYLKRCIDVQIERGKQYDSEGTGERSFQAAADAFNALTGEKLSGSDVCLLMVCLKVVRQNSNKSRIHDDSLLDGVSYLSLWADELTKELK